MRKRKRLGAGSVGEEEEVKEEEVKEEE